MKVRVAWFSAGVLTAVAAVGWVLAALAAGFEIDEDTTGKP